MGDYLDQLERLAGLFERGALSKAEFEAEKARLIWPGARGPESSHTRLIEWFAQHKTVLAVVASLLAGTLLGVLVWQDLKEGTSPAAVKKQDRATAAESLEGSFAFSDPGACALSLEFAAVVDQLATSSERKDEATVSVAGFPEPEKIDSAVIGSGIAEARISRVHVPGLWHGLKLKELRTTRWTGAEGMQMRFEQSAPQAANVLRELGFKLPVVGSLNKVGNLLIGVEDVGDGAAFTCITVSKYLTASEGHNGGTD